MEGFWQGRVRGGEFHPFLILPSCHAGAKGDPGAKESPQARKFRDWQLEVAPMCTKVVRMRVDVHKAAPPPLSS